MVLNLLMLLAAACLTYPCRLESSVTQNSQRFLHGPKSFGKNDVNGTSIDKNLGSAVNSYALLSKLFVKLLVSLSSIHGMIKDLAMA